MQCQVANGALALIGQSFFPQGRPRVVNLSWTNLAPYDLGNQYAPSLSLELPQIIQM